MLAANIRKDVSIHIVEPAEQQLTNASRFSTCAVAAYDHCYFQDDLALNLYMDTLYTNFLQHPDIIHATAKPTVYPNYIRWRFSNQGKISRIIQWFTVARLLTDFLTDIQMHTGYMDFRYGAFVSREKLQTFLAQTSALQKQSITSSSSWESFAQAETAFVIWTNQYPWLLANPLLPGGHEPSDNVNPDAVNVLQKNMASFTVHTHSPLLLTLHQNSRWKLCSS